MTSRNAHYDLIAQTIEYLQPLGTDQTDLDALAKQFELTVSHLQDSFASWVGMTCDQFMPLLSKSHLKGWLNQSNDLVSKAHSQGLKVNCVTVPSGEGLKIRYGFVSTPFGKALIGQADQGVCYLQFVDREDNELALDDLRQAWPDAELVADPHGVHALGSLIFSSTDQLSCAINVMLQGTNFQIKVWETLAQIPAGVLQTYSDVAAATGKKNAHRAVGNALAANTIAYLIPCHRVIRSEGEPGQFRWGIPRKLAMLGWEQAHAQA